MNDLQFDPEFTNQADEIARLRAELAESQAKRTEWLDWCDEVKRIDAMLRAQIDDLVEAVALADEEKMDMREHARVAQARLAAVIALCDNQEIQSSYYGERAWLRISLVRAAATGDSE